MSEIKALESLRNCLSSATYDGMFDEIQAEVDERFMELPLDADGVPIRVGDLVTLNNGEPFKVGGIRDAGNQWHIFRYELHRWWSPLDLHHVKPRTLEDVLEDFRAHYDSWEDNSYGANRGIERKELFEQTAAEICELLGVDA